MLLDYITVQTLRSIFSTAACQKGQDYYFDKRVEDLECIHESPERERIAAIVTGGRPYRLIVDIVGPVNRISIRSQCSCSLGGHCKHVVAALLAAMERLSLGNIRLAPPSPVETSTVKKIATADPVPCLRLFQGFILMPLTSMQVQKAMVRLSFDYEGVRISWAHQGDKVSHIENDKLIHILRNRTKEENALDQLRAYHVLAVRDILDSHSVNARYANDFLIDHTECDPFTFSADALPALRAAGWRIEIDESYAYHIINDLNDVSDVVDEWYSVIEDNRYDWFGLELGIIIKGEKINLLPVLQKLLHTMSGKKTLNDSIFVTLDDGRYIQLPRKRVHDILNVLVELYDDTSLTDKKMLRLSHLHAARLLELEKACGATALRWFGGEKQRKLALELQQFSGIEHATLPLSFKGELRHYQQEGLNWLQFLRKYEFGGILADDMGLGKTVQALAHMLLEKTSGRARTPHLVVAPTSLMFNWRFEAERFAPDLKILVLHGPRRQLESDTLQQYDLILTTYSLLVRDKEILLKQPFYLLVLDEAQYIKNTKSLATQVALQIQASYRLCLTGTPMENHLGELWSLFHFLMPGLLDNQKKFNRLFRVPIEKQGDQDRRMHLNRRIAPFLLRRTKDAVVQELPPKVEMIRHVELEGAQRDLYETIRMTMQNKIKKDIAVLGLARSRIVILDALLKLRQVCCDPRLLEMDTVNKNNVGSAKLELLMTLIPELLAEGRRILLFSQFTSMLRLIEAGLQQKNIPYLLLTGQTRDRETPVRQFQAGVVPLFLISLKAGGTGLNLTAADAVIHYDPWWNPAVEQQATDRAHRIGQDKTVFVYKFITKGTVEEKIVTMQEHKSKLMDGLFSEKTSSTVQLTEQDLQALFEPLDSLDNHTETH